MFRKLKERRKIKKSALQFADKINRLGDLFKSYGFDVGYRGNIWNSKSNFKLRLQGDNVLELITKLGKELNDVKDYSYLRGYFNQKITVQKISEYIKDNIDISWKYEYYGYHLSAKLRDLDTDIRYMESLVYKKEESE